MIRETDLPCSRCGAPLAGEAAGGLCPRCLMALHFDSRTMPEGEEPVPVAPLTPEEMAEHFPQYEILECLGRGGMGVVYKARQKRLDREVAIKVLAGEWQGDAAFARRFEREAKTLAQMSHPNIVTVHDFGESGGVFHLVMEYVDGVNLRDLLQDGTMAPGQALSIIPSVCEALDYAHGKGVVHRDIKPENILLDRDGRVKIADFGIASLVGATGEKSGTPPYMAPEQNGGNVDRRADIYALGVVLYEMLTGERPGVDVVAPSRKVEVDVRIDEMVLRALEVEPERRYQTAGEFRTVVETMVEQRTGSTVPKPSRIVSGGTRDRHAVDRSRTRIRSRVVVIGLAVMVALGCLWWSRRQPSLEALQLRDAWSLWQTGRAIEAKKIFEGIVGREPANADAWNGLGWSSLHSGDTATAERAFGKVLEIDPGHRAALDALVQAVLASGEFDRAEALLLERAGPDTTAVWSGLARLYLLQGKLDQAEAWAGKMTERSAADELAARIHEAAAKARQAQVSRDDISKVGTALPRPESSAELSARRNQLAQGVANALARGLGEQHPQVLALRSQMASLGPGVAECLDAERLVIGHLHAAGLGENHPTVRACQARIDALMQDATPPSGSDRNE